METPNNPHFFLTNEQTNIKVNLTLENQNNILVILAKNEPLKDFNEYMIEYTLSSLYKLHKSFKMFETIDEIIEFLSQIIQAKEVKIYPDNEKGGLILELNISIGVKKEKIKIKLHKR